MAFVRLFLAIASLAILSNSARALVGPTLDGAAYRTHVIMVLAQSGRGAGFCSGVTLAPNVVLTAAHCVAAPAATRVHFRDSNGAPVLMNVRRVARHPLYRADAVQARAKSVDLALVETAGPLPEAFAATSIGEAIHQPGGAFDVVGFGVARAGDASTSGVLRRARLALRAPISNVLLWLDSAEGAGACTGDSGAPVFSNGALVAIVAFAQGQHGRGCGGLTQAVRVAPYRNWVDATIAGWR